MNDPKTPNNSNQNIDLDNPIQLYLARIENGMGTLILSQEGERKITLYGEIVIESSGLAEGKPIIDTMRRAAFWTDPVEELGGVLSFVGSAEKFMPEPSSNKGELAPLDMRIYYPLLSQLDPAYVESDAMYPQLETLRGRMIWELGDSIDEKAFRLQIEMILDEPLEVHLGAIKQLSLSPTTLTFEILEGGGESKAPTHRSLIPCTSSTLNPTGTKTYYELKMRFINLSPTRTVAELEGPSGGPPGIIQQLVNRACDVWWAKGGIKIVPDGVSIASASLPWPGGAVSQAQEQSLSSIQATVNAVEVYLVDQLTNRPGGAFTYNCGTDAAFVIIDIGKAEHNKYLLAHEVGHVLGLMHPDGTGGPAYRNGSTCSVMVVDKPNSSRNTSNNLGVDQPTIDSSLPPNTLAQVLDPVGTGGWATDDGYEHYIRDFPYDHAVQPSVPEPPALRWWTHSDVWNYNRPPADSTHYDDFSDIFDSQDNFPNACEPTYSGPNYMYVRLRATHFNQPISVYLFLAVPGSAAEPLTLVPPSGAANPIMFLNTNFPADGSPVMKHIQWTVSDDPTQYPAGFPSACCVFAVAYSTNEPNPPATEPMPHIIDIINDVTAHPNNSQYHFIDLFNRLKSDNDVAQRNLHIQGTPPPPSPSPGTSRSSASTLSWVQIDNPFKESAPARLEIDATQAQGLEGLALEVNDEIVREIKPGEQTSVTITDALGPGEHKVLRFRVALPPTAKEGMAFPIHLRFMVNNELVSGYSHILRVVPLGEAMLQVLDLVFGSLRDVAVGCKSDLAQFVANRARIIVFRERSRRSPGCFGLLWRLLRPQNAWRSDLTNMSAEIAAVAQSLSDRSEPECQMVQRRLNEFSELLRNSKDMPVAILIEQIRDVADRIQEPAGRLVRQQLQS